PSAPRARRGHAPSTRPSAPRARTRARREHAVGTRRARTTYAWSTTRRGRSGLEPGRQARGHVLGPAHAAPDQRLAGRGRLLAPLLVAREQPAAIARDLGVEL